MNSRQTAIVVWAGIALVWCVFQPKVRQSLLAVVRAALNLKLLIPALLSLIWIASTVYGMYCLGLWTPDLWWDTLVFALIGSTGLVMRIMDGRDFTAVYYWSLVVQTFAITALISVVAGMYTFSLPVELVLVPWLCLLGAIQAYAGAKDEYKSIRTPVAFAIGMTGLAILSRAVGGAIADYTRFLSLDTVVALLLAFALTVAYMPFLFMLRVFMNYELAFIPIRLGVKKPFQVRIYARLRIVARHHLRLGRLHEFRTGVGKGLRMADTRAAVDRVFSRDTPAVGELRFDQKHSGDE